MRHLRYITFIFLLLGAVPGKTQSTRAQKKFWKQVRKEMPEFRKVFRQYKKYRFEVFYTRVQHEPQAGNIYQYYSYGDHDQYFYPASTVKFPIALRALQKINNLREDSVVQTNNPYILPKDSLWCNNVDKSYLAHRYLRVKDSLSLQHAAAMGGLSRETFCRINHLDLFQKIAPGKTIRLSENPEPIAFNDMLNEMLLYSNNNDFNWMYDFAVNESTPGNGHTFYLRKRLKVCTNADSAATRALLLKEPENMASFSPEKININARHLFKSGYVVGKKYYGFNDQLIDHGRDFSYHNELLLEDLQEELIQLIYPSETLSTYRLGAEQRRQLIYYMGMRPSEDKVVTDSAYLKVPDDFTNFLYTGQKHAVLPNGLRIVNIIGQAYGFVTDCAYFADAENKFDFFLAARIYVNKDGILNDDKYEYESIAYPLMEKLGKVIYRYEQQHRQGVAALPEAFQIFR